MHEDEREIQNFTVLHMKGKSLKKSKKAVKDILLSLLDMRHMERELINTTYRGDLSPATDVLISQVEGKSSPLVEDEDYLPYVNLAHVCNQWLARKLWMVEITLETNQIPT